MRSCDGEGGVRIRRLRSSVVIAIDYLPHGNHAGVAKKFGMGGSGVKGEG